MNKRYSYNGMIYCEDDLSEEIENYGGDLLEILTTEIKTQYENDILKEVQRVGINIDKNALIKALKYDRYQYEKGFKDARELYEKSLDMACEVLSHDLQKIDINGDEKLVLESAEKWKEFFLNYEDND